MPNTIQLHTLPPIAAGKRLADVQAGRMTMAQYLTELGQTCGVTAGWTPQGDYLIDFGRGVTDPSGLLLDIGELLEVVKALMPSPLRSAGRTIRLRGPMPGAAAALVARVCYAARLVVEVQDRQTGLIRDVPIDRLERDRVRLVAPDGNERETALGNGWVLARTSQLSYRRPAAGPRFAYQGTLELVFLETRAHQQGAPRAQVYDGRYYAWVDDLAHLEDVP